jgi:UDP-2,3-diacylglucosamine hydrolase
VAAAVGDPAPGHELPPVARWQADPAWRRIDLVSDLHLSATMPRTAEAFAAHLRHTPADAVLLLGDVFELWVGDDQRRGDFERSMLASMAEAGRRRTLAFMPGNRDFLFGEAAAQAAGLVRLADPTALHAFGRCWLLSHGDALCLADTEYQAFRQLSRSPAWQSAFLARPLADRLAEAGAARAASQARRDASGADPTLWADVDPDAAQAWLRLAGSDVLIHGHTHRPGSVLIAPGLVRHVLTDWDLDHAAAGRAEVLALQADGLRRLPPSR